METVERIEGEGKPIAIIVRNDFNRPGVNFFSPFDFSQQLGILVHPAGHEFDIPGIFRFFDKYLK